MGHPAAGIAWLVVEAALDARLEAGQIVLAGSFTRPVSIAAERECRHDQRQDGPHRPPRHPRPARYPI